MKTASRWKSLNVSCLLWPIVITRYLLLLPMTRMFTFSTKYFYFVHKIFLSPDRSHRRGPQSCSCSAGSCGRCLQSSFRENTSSPPFKVALNMGFDLALEQKIGRLRNAADIFINCCCHVTVSTQKARDIFISDNDKNILYTYAWWLPYMPLCHA